MRHGSASAKKNKLVLTVRRGGDLLFASLCAEALAKTFRDAVISKRHSQNTHFLVSFLGADTMRDSFVRSSRPTTLLCVGFDTGAGGKGPARGWTSVVRPLVPV